MSSDFCIESERILLRPTHENDLDHVLTAEQSAENAQFVIQWTRQQHLSAITNPAMLHMVWLVKPDHVFSGYTVLSGIGDTNDSIEFKRVVSVHKERGHGREVLRMLKELVFEQLRAHRFWLDVMEHNRVARRLYESEGFLVEGVLRECIKRDERYTSLIVMSMLQHEYARAAENGR